MAVLAGGQQRVQYQQYTSPPLTVQQIQQLQALQAQQQQQQQLRASQAPQARPTGVQQGAGTYLKHLSKGMKAPRELLSSP